MFRRLPKFEYLTPITVEEACLLLSQHRGNAKLLAGGTDLLVRIRERKLTPQYVISLNNILDLQYIKPTREGGFRIGSLTKHQAIADCSFLWGKCDSLVVACRRVGTPQIRNMGTIGGNLCNAGPSADTASPLLVLRATLTLQSIRGQRAVPIENFFLAPFKCDLAEDEILTGIEIPPPPPKTGSSYQWLTKITTVDETLVGVAALITLSQDDKVCQEARIALGSVAPTPVRAPRAEEVLRGKRVDHALIERAAEVAITESQPRSRAEYRRQMIAVLVKKALQEAINRAKA